MCEGDRLIHIREYLLGLAEITYPNAIVGAPEFKYDKRQDGWTLLEDTREPWPISVAKTELVPFLKEGEERIGGEEMVRRSREELHIDLGQKHAEYLLDHQAEIPEEFRKFVMVFTGTVWRDRVGRRYVPYLYWFGERWCLGFGWLGRDFRDDCRLLRPRE